MLPAREILLTTMAATDRENPDATSAIFHLCTAPDESGRVRNARRAGSDCLVAHGSFGP